LGDKIGGRGRSRSLVFSLDQRYRETAFRAVSLFWVLALARSSGNPVPIVEPPVFIAATRGFHGRVETPSSATLPKAADVAGFA
jgi:hypothetical protein